MEGDRRGPPAQRRTPHAIPIFVGPLVRSRPTKPCPIYFEVSFLDNNKPQESPRRLDAIVFRNFYCSHITVKRRRPRRQQQLDGAKSGGIIIDSDPWVTLLRDRPLMEDPHYEDDAQFWHVVTTDEFDQDEYDAESTEPLRIYVYQPSPVWKTFGLQHFKCVGWSASAVVAPSDEDHIGDNNNNNNNSSSRNISINRCTRDGGGEGGGRETAANLGELCRGISEQVQIFGDKRSRVRRLS